MNNVGPTGQIMDVADTKVVARSGLSNSQVTIEEDKQERLYAEDGGPPKLGKRVASSLEG